MVRRKLALFLLASTTFLFSSKSTAQSEKDIAWWADGLARNHIESIAKSIGIDIINTSGISSAISRLSGGLIGFPIAETYDDVIWETLKQRLDDNKIYEAIKVMEHIKIKNISSPNSTNITNYFGKKIWDSLEETVKNDVSQAFVLESYIEEREIIPDNSSDRAENFYLIGTQLTNEKDCSKIENTLFAYKIALSLDSNFNQKEGIYQFADFCDLESNNVLTNYYNHYILAYVIGLKLNPSAESYLKLSSKISHKILIGERLSQDDLINNANISTDIILDASKQVLELPDKNIEIVFPLYLTYNEQALMGNPSSILPSSSSNWGQKVTSSSHALAYTLIGNVSAKSGNLNKANSAFQQAITLDKNLSMAYAGLGKAQILQSRFEEAEKALQTAISLNQNYADAYNSLGNLFTKKEQLRKAVDAYRKALSIAPNYSPYTANLAEAERQLALANQIEPKLDTSVRNSIVIVKARKMTGDCGDGTGWIVNSSNNQAWIITNRHVVQGCNNIKIKLNNDSSQTFSANIFKIDEEKDLAVLKVANLPTNIESLPIALAQPNINDTVFVVGHPYQGEGSSWTTVKGEVSSIVNQLLQLDITVDGGNSGSPVLNKSNEVIGLLFELSNDRAYEGSATGRFGFAYPINVVREKLDSWEVPYENK